MIELAVDLKGNSIGMSLAFGIGSVFNAGGRQFKSIQDKFKPAFKTPAKTRAHTAIDGTSALVKTGILAIKKTKKSN